MNIKKSIMKTMCAALACATIMSNALAAYAIDAIVTETPMDSGGGGWTADESSMEEIEVIYEQASSYSVIIPKTIVLDRNKQANYSITVTGEIKQNERVHVVPVDAITETENVDFYMKEQASDSKKADVVATVTQNKFYWNSEEAANSHEEKNNFISASNLTAGTWKGIFHVTINLETNASHTHNYVDGICTECGEADPNAGHEHNYTDGKCECGAIDPDHIHNYEDGTCTICGKPKSDPYDTAPASAYINWNYTLNNENNVITLNYYKGSETDVIVYANYVVNGKTYKTEIASNGNDSAVSTYYMFNGVNWENCQNIKSIIFSKSIDTSNVTSMRDMFLNCSSLTDLDLSSFDTSNVTNMRDMFRGCSSLTCLDLSSFDTSNVTNMNCMFCYCNSLVGMDLSSFDTGNVTNMGGMFQFCKSLTSLDLSSFDTKNVTIMSGMLSGCNLLTNLDLGNMDTSNVTSMMNMFDFCNSLTSLDLSSFDTNKVTNMGYMFRGCTSLTNLELSSFDTSSVTNMTYMFQNCNSLTSLDLSSFNTGNVTNMTYMFQDAKNLATIYVSRNKWILATNRLDIFKNCGTSTVTYK